MIKVVPRGVDGLFNVTAGLLLEKGSQGTIYESSQSLSSGAGEKEARVLFLGYTEAWERDMWSSWLTEVSVD